MCIYATIHWAEPIMRIHNGMEVAGIRRDRAGHGGAAQSVAVAISVPVIGPGIRLVEQSPIFFISPNITEILIAEISGQFVGAVQVF